MFYNENPLSSSAMRFNLFPAASPEGPGPRETRPFGLQNALSFPVPERRSSNYSDELQMSVDVNGLPLALAKKNDDPPKPSKEWESKTYSDGDEGQEEDNWGWEEQ